MLTVVLTGLLIPGALSPPAPSSAPWVAIVKGFLGIPFTIPISHDAFHFRFVPILARAAAVYGIGAAETGAAAVIGRPVHLPSPLAGVQHGARCARASRAPVTGPRQAHARPAGLIA